MNLNHQISLMDYRQYRFEEDPGDELLSGGAKTDYNYDDPNVMPSGFLEGIFVKSLVNARGGPNLLTVSRPREKYMDPLYDPAWPMTQGDELKAMYDITQHRIEQINREAETPRQWRFFTGPRWTGSQVAIDPYIMTMAEGACDCKEVTRGSAMNASLYNKIRYPSD